MKNKFTFIIISILAAILFLAGCAQKETQAPDDKNTGVKPNIEQKGTEPAANELEMVDCGKMEDPYCFMNRMNQCLPVTAKMVGSDDTTSIEMTIFGIENETCHFQRKINNVIDLNCFFPKGTMNKDTLDQTFGNDKGLQKVVDDACKSGW